MLAAERRSLILQQARSEGSVRVADLVDRLRVSDVTIRRDLDFLAVEGLVTKVHGGAVLVADPVPEPVAVTPASEGTLTVGVLLPSSIYYFKRIIEGINGVLAANDARLTLAVSNYRAADEPRLVSDLLKAGAQALLLTPSAESGPESAWVGRLPVPAVLVERRMTDQEATGLSWVRIAHERGAAMAVEHLHALGHTRIGLFIRGDTPTAISVRTGWREALVRLGLDEDVPCESGLDIPGWPHWSAEDATRFLSRLRKENATALLCHSDEDALALAQHCRSAGISVPDDLSIIASGNELAEFTTPSLTCIAPPKTQVGALAARTLLDLLAAPGTAAAVHIDLEPSLITRASTAAAKPYKKRR
ncbi:substrate-binding domain-containing protein [Streptosporangium canum]|uniref:substrate-binding domain-containing protein n=1 Tax=Streptosporangium canum TaxID=324952 RepID=UPI0033A0BE8E